MNKRYMDFVPKKASGVDSGAKKSVRPEVKLPDGSRARVVAEQRATKETDVRLEEIFEEREPEQNKKPKFGVIEDFSGKFVNAKVEKRPLSASAEAKAAKAKKIPRISLLSKSKVKEVKSTKSTQSAMGNTAARGGIVGNSGAMISADGVTESKMKIPSRPFVNTERVTKRPLSGNVYQPKKVVEPKEEPKGTITIIEKPEKDSKVGLVVTIIITIILGAAAGTVAFLLLPK